MGAVGVGVLVLGVAIILGLQRRNSPVQEKTPLRINREDQVALQGIEIGRY